MTFFEIKRFENHVFSYVKTIIFDRKSMIEQWKRTLWTWKLTFSLRNIRFSLGKASCNWNSCNDIYLYNLFLFDFDNTKNCIFTSPPILILWLQIKIISFFTIFEKLNELGTFLRTFRKCYFWRKKIPFRVEKLNKKLFELWNDFVSRISWISKIQPFNSTG